MYNRYIRNDRGSYTRIPEDEEPASNRGPEPRRQEDHRYRERRREENRPPPGGEDDEFRSLLRRALDRFHLEHIDSGDLILLLLLYLLFREDADEELLIALGLLLIL